MCKHTLDEAQAGACLAIGIVVSAHLSIGIQVHERPRGPHVSQFLAAEAFLAPELNTVLDHSPFGQSQDVVAGPTLGLEAHDAPPARLLLVLGSVVGCDAVLDHLLAAACIHELRLRG